MKVFIGRYPSHWVLTRNPNAEQTKRIRIDPWDTWNMAETLADIITPMLIQLRDECHGAPGDIPNFHEISNDWHGQYTFDWYKTDDEKAHELGHKKWREYLDKMIWSFKEMQTFDRNTKFFIYKNGTKKFDKPAYDAYYQKIQEGLDLFAKYYLNLWD